MAREICSRLFYTILKSIVLEKQGLFLYLFFAEHVINSEKLLLLS